MKLFVDDVRTPPDDSWIVTKTYQDAIKLIDKHTDQIELISLDHDLGLDSCKIEYDHGGNEVYIEQTGYDILLHIVQRKFDGKPIPKEFRVHSANPVGVERMNGVIERYLK